MKSKTTRKKIYFCQIIFLSLFFILLRNERLKMKKLVDGCVGAISNDVKVRKIYLQIFIRRKKNNLFHLIKRIVNQKLIDETKHAKLEAERDQPSSSKFSRGSRIKASVTSANSQIPSIQVMMSIKPYW